MTPQTLYLFLAFMNVVLAIVLIAERRTVLFVLAGCLSAGSCSRELTRTGLQEHSYTEAAIYAVLIMIISIMALRARGVRSPESPPLEAPQPARATGLNSLILMINLAAAVAGIVSGVIALLQFRG